MFGPSAWDSFAPGAPESVVNSVTEALDAGFKAAHPEIGRIVHDSRGPVAEGLSRLRNAVLAGDPVDVIICAANPVNTSFARMGLIRPLDALVQSVAADLADGAIESYRVGDHIWGVPLSAVATTTFFYNKALFAKAGITTPATYDAFKDAARKLTQQGIIPVVHQGRNAWMWPFYYMNALAETTGNRQLAFTQDVLRGKAKFTDGPSLQALRLTRAWIDDGIVDPLSNELDEDAMKSVFFAGKSAAYFGVSWDLPGVTANAGFDWGVFQFPQYEGQPGHPVSFGGVDSGLCVSSHSAHPDLAEAYIAFAVRPDNARMLLAPLQAIATTEQGVPGIDTEIAKQLRQTLPPEKFLDWVWPRELTDTIQRQIQAMMGGTVTPEDAAAAIQAKYDSMAGSGYRYGD